METAASECLNFTFNKCLNRNGYMRKLGVVVCSSYYIVYVVGINRFNFSRAQLRVVRRCLIPLLLLFC